MECESNVSIAEESDSSKSVSEMSEIKKDPSSAEGEATPSEPPQPPRRGRPGRKKRGVIYNDNEDPETLKEKKKQRAVELKLKNLECTFNQTTTEVTPKRQKKAPQRFEIIPANKRKSAVEDCQGRGQQLGNINWINHQLRAASLYTLRLLHRLIYRKQGMFAEKQIRKSVMKFSGFPFDANHPEIKRRRELLEKCNVNALHQLRQVLGLRPGSKEEMTDAIMDFLLRPSQQMIEDYITEVMNLKMQQAKLPHDVVAQLDAVSTLQFIQPIQDDDDDDEQPKEKLLSLPKIEAEISKVGDANALSCAKAMCFKEGHGVKLKFIRAVSSNLERASDTFIELMHRLLFLNVDKVDQMRSNILEFSGLECDSGTSYYVYRMRILSVLPIEQLKLICQVLCLPTWHRSRQLLTEAIMDFLAVPRISAMKKRVPPLFSEECSFSFDCGKITKVALPEMLPELKSVESEEIEIVPDIHISDETTNALDCDSMIENEYIGVKLKNFSNIHYQVISTPAAKLADVHMVLYLTTCALNNIRKNILEFSGFPFDESSRDYICRRGLMEQLSLDELKVVATVLCVSQYIVDDSKKSLIDAILKFLLKPSALLNSSTIMPTISPVSERKKKPTIVKKNATSTSPQCKSKVPEIILSDKLSDIVISKVESLPVPVSKKEVIKPEIIKLKACFAYSDIEITPVTQSVKNEVSSVKESPITIKKEPTEEPRPVTSDLDEPLSSVKKSVSIVPLYSQYFGSDEDDDQPLSKMIGHPNDDQLRLLVAKIMKESKLEDITMKQVVCKVFETYPNFDLGYRKEFIKSIVRQILSQMDEQSCSVSTTVINI